MFLIKLLKVIGTVSQLAVTVRIKPTEDQQWCCMCAGLDEKCDKSYFILFIYPNTNVQCCTMEVGMQRINILVVVSEI